MTTRPQLIGREDELRRLRTAGPGLTVIVGPPGVGKSAVLTAARPDALYIDASGAASVHDLAAALGRQLDLEEAGPSEVGWALAAQEKTDLVIDQADALVPLALPTLISWVELAPNLRIGLTSRVRPPRGDVLELHPLTETEAVMLLRAEAGGLVAEALLPDLARALDCLPLALVYAGRRLRLFPAAALLATPALAAEPDRLANLAADSLERLTPGARALLGRLALFEGSLPVDEALKLVGAAEIEHLQELRDASLLQPSATGLRVSSPARLAARRTLTPEAAASARRVHTEYVARRLALPGIGPELRPDLEAAVRRLLRLDDIAGAAALLAATSEHIDSWGPGGISSLVDSCLIALPPSATLRGVLLLLRARLRLAQADVIGARTDAEEAWQALPKDVEPARLVVHACIRQGDLTAGTAALERGLTITQGAPELLLERGLLALDAGDTDAAGVDFDAARRGFEAAGDRPGAAQAELRRALAALQSGDAATGVPALHAVERELDDLGQTHLVAVARWYLAWAALEMGDDGVAAHLAEKALNGWRSRGDQLGEARAQGLIGVIALLAGDVEGAGRAFDDAEAAREDPGRPRFTVLLLEARSILLARQGRPAQARALLARAAALASNLPAQLADGIERTRIALSGDRLAGPSRLRTRLLALLDRPSEPASASRVLRATADGRWFRLPPGSGVDIARRAAPRRILDALIAAAPEGRALDVFAIVEAGWPDERLHPDAGRARAYTAIRSLRRFGLQDVLVRLDDGYVLDPAVQLEVVAQPGG